MRSHPARILITGATGFIGRALVRRLAASVPPDALCLPVREPARAVRLGLPRECLVEGMLADPAGLRAAIGDVEVVVHLAGAVRARSQAEFAMANVAATANLLAALPSTARFVLVSSLAASRPSTDGVGTAEPPHACRPCSRYGESKRQGELVLLADAARTGRSWLVLRPCLVYGPGDGATALLFRQARAVACPVPRPARPLSTLHVHDMCAALELAIARPEANQAFVPIAGDITDTHRLMRAIAAAGGRRARLVSVPDRVIRGAGAVTDLVARMRRRPSYFSSDKAREITAVGWVADRAPARTVLGFSASVSLQQGLADVALATS